MSDIGSPDREFDLQPDPRILPMLGEINLHQWQCLAELVDNSIDGFLSARSEDLLDGEPEVYVSLPTRDAGSAQISVRDNGFGMDPDTLENAVRAGWTGHGPIDRLGLFGMGFNIATARLGTVTRVWSTRRNDLEWHGLEIDFSKLQRQGHFRTPMLQRSKVDPEESGTEIVIENLKPDQRDWIARGVNRKKIRDRLSQVYSAMLRADGEPVPLNLSLNGTRVRGYQHCVWGDPRDSSPPRTVEHRRWGEIEAFQRMNRDLGTRPFCTDCWLWLRPGDEVCRGCESKKNVVRRERRIHGWLGIQRYYDENDFGIDFLRNGRKIELQNHDLFYWMDGVTREKEYPIDDPRDRGRIVGEIHIDHCRVTYTKSNFDRTDPAWQEMVEVVRGRGPIRPDKARELGYPENKSPLFRLFQAFRRNTPKPKVAGCYANLLVVSDNDQARELAKKYRDGDPEYQSDERWWRLVEAADRKLLIEDPTGEREEEDNEDFWEDGEGDEGKTGEEEPGEPPKREPLPALSREYRSHVTEQRWELQAYSVLSTDPVLGAGKLQSPWLLRRTTAGPYNFFVNLKHAVFQSATLTDLDALLAELAWSAMDFLRSSGGESDATYGAVLADLRDRYASHSQLDPVSLKWEADELLERVASRVGDSIEAGRGVELYEQIPEEDRQRIVDKIALAREGARDAIIEDGRFVQHAPRRVLIILLQRHPELFFDGSFWDLPYAELGDGDVPVSDRVRNELIDRYASLLQDAVWLAEGERADLEKTSRAQLLRASLAIELLNTDVAEETS